MKRLIAAAAVLLLAGCQLSQVDDFRQAVPKADTVAMKVPGSTGQALEGVRRDGLEGDTAELYKLTRGITVFVNGAGVVVLSLVKTVTDNQPTTVTADSAVWGPYTDALSPNTWKLTVTKTGTDAYTYVLEGKDKNKDDSNYVAVLSGSHVNKGNNLGSGSFLLDFDAAARLPEHNAGDQGTAQYTYSHTSLSADTTIDAVFTKVKDHDTGGLVDATYKYLATPATGGSLEFAFTKDFGGGPALETAVIKSRWQQSGAGRSDIKISGGNAPANAVASECWDSNFASRYLNNSFDAAANYGNESVCLFHSAEYASITP